jgi:hypothetical protein
MDALKRPRAKRSRPALRTAALRKATTAAPMLPKVPAKIHSAEAKERRAERLTVGKLQELQTQAHGDLAKERTAAEKDAIAAKELKARLKGVKKVWRAEPKGDPDPMEIVSSPRCTAHSRNGERCRKSPIPGGTVCRNHGGGSPKVIKSARERLLAAVDPAISSLTGIAKLAENRKVLSDLLQRNPRVLASIVRATTAILDRSGYPATKEYVIGTPEQAKARMAALLGVRVEELPADDDPHGERSIHAMPMRSIPAAIISPSDPAPEDGAAPDWTTFLSCTSEAEAIETLGALTVRGDAEAALSAELAGLKRATVMEAAISSPAWTSAPIAPSGEESGEPADTDTDSAIEPGEVGAEEWIEV